MITKFKLFESNSELIDQLDNEFIENYFNEHHKLEDFDEIINMAPHLIWSHIDDDSAMSDIIQDEINARDLEDFNEDDIKEHIKTKTLDESIRYDIYKKNIEDEVDLEELSNLKNKLKETTNKKQKENIEEDIENIENEIEKIKERDINEAIDYLSENSLHDIIDEHFDRYDIIHDILTDMYKNYSVEKYINEIYGRPDDITFGSHYDMFGRKTGGGFDWVLNYVDEQAVIDEWNENEEFNYKKERVEEELPTSKKLQDILLEIDPKNAIELFDVIENYSDTIGDEYDFQKAYIEEFAKNYASDLEDNNIDDEDLKEGKEIAVKNIVDNFELDPQIENEYPKEAKKAYARKKARRFNL